MISQVRFLNAKLEKTLTRHQRNAISLFLGFNPVWNSDHFVIRLKAPEVALLRICVKDYDFISANDFIGQYTIPVMSITPGKGYDVIVDLR